MNKKLKGGIVYSTNPDFKYETNAPEEQETLPPAQQLLLLSLDKKQRAGKVVTLVEGFVGTNVDLEALAKFLKSKCGVGGSTKDGAIMIQGDWKEKVAEWLQTKGYKVKKKG